MSGNELKTVSGRELNSEEGSGEFDASGTDSTSTSSFDQEKEEIIEIDENGTNESKGVGIESNSTDIIDVKKQYIRSRKRRRYSNVQTSSENNKPKVRKMKNFRNLAFCVFCLTCICFSKSKNILNTFLKSIRLTLVKIMVKCFPLCRFPNVSFEENLKNVFVYCTQILAHISHILFTFVWYSSHFYDPNMNWETFFVIGVHIISISITYSCFCCAFTCKLNRLFLKWPMALLMNYLFCGCIIFSSNYLRGSSICVALIIPALFMFSVDSNDKIFWVVSYIIYLFIAMTYQVCRTLVENEPKTLQPGEMVHIFLIQFTSYVINASFVFFYHWYLFANFKSFKLNIEKIARAITILKFDSPEILELMNTEDEISSTHSILLKQIIENIMEYKAFIPQGLIVLHDSDEQLKDEENMEDEDISDEEREEGDEDKFDEYDDDDDVELYYTTVNKEKKRSNHKKTVSLTTTDFYDSEGEERKPPPPRPQKVQLPSPPPQVEEVEKVIYKTTPKQHHLGGGIDYGIIDYSIRVRHGSLALFDLSGWNDVLEMRSPSDYSRYYSQFMEIVCEEMENSKGFVILLTNDKVMCGWNIKNTVVHHESSCVNAVYQIIRRLSLSTSLKSNKVRPLPFYIPIAVGIVSGDVICGNMGCSKIKSFNFFGRVTSLVYALNRYAKKKIILGSSTTPSSMNRGHLSPHVILIDQETNDRISFEFKTIFVNRVYCKKSIPFDLQEKMEINNEIYFHRIYKLECPIGYGDEEYMYTKNVVVGTPGIHSPSSFKSADFQAIDDDENLNWVLLEQYYCDGNFKAARKQVEKVEEEDEETYGQNKSILEDLRSNIDEGKRFSTIE